MLEELESKLDELFEKENILKCAERWKESTKRRVNSNEEYIEALKERLTQGRVEF